MALTPKNTDKGPDKEVSESSRLSAEDEIAIREIDEAVRKDDAAEFVQRYGLAIGGVLAAVLLGLGGYLFWNSSIEAGLEAESEQIINVQDYSDARDFASVRERTTPLLDSKTVGVRTSARLLRATAALEMGDTEQAVELFAQIAADDEAPQTLRDFARLREVATSFDSREPAEIIEKLSDLAVPGNALFGSAAELTAIAHLEAGNQKQAGQLFAAIAKDDELPESLRDRARQMTGQLGVDAVEDVEELLEDEGVSPDSSFAPSP